jgi:MFS family permease
VAPANADAAADGLALAAHGAPAIHQRTLTTWRALQRVPALAGIAFVGGVFETGLSSLSAANGAAAGLSLGGAASIVGVLGFGSFLLQLPAGLMADRVAPSKVFGAAGALLLASSILFAWADNALWLLWACAFVWGGVGGSLYTLTMIRVAHQFKGHDTAAGTATMITGYTLGGAMGPLVGGAMLQGFALPGLAVWLALLSLGVMGLSGALSARRAGRVS